MDLKRIKKILQSIRGEGREVLLETEGLEILKAMGICIPTYTFVKHVKEVSTIDLSTFPGEKVVVKVISPEILHKSEAGGIAFVSKDRSAITEVIKTMDQRFQGLDVKGFTIHQFIHYDPSLGGELLVGLRWTEDFGPIVTYGTGGIYTEFLTENFKNGRNLAILSPELSDGEKVEPLIQGVAVTSLITG